MRFREKHSEPIAFAKLPAVAVCRTLNVCFAVNEQEIERDRETTDSKSFGALTQFAPEV